MTRRTLDLGCGTSKESGAIGVDISLRSHADVIADFRSPHLPFRTSSVERVVMNHLLEHVYDVETFLREVHRIAKPDAEVIIRVPHFTSVYAFTDFTHRHFFSSRSFDRYVRGLECSYYDTHIFDPTDEFRLLERTISFEAVFSSLRIGRWRGVPLHKLVGLEWMINHLLLDAYEKRFAFWLPASELKVRLEVVK